MTEHEIAYWLELCRVGNIAAQKRVFEHYYSYALNVCKRYAKNTEEAEEILSDAFYKVFKKIEQYTPNTSFKAWFYRILVNTAIEYFRKYHQGKEKYVQEIDTVITFAAEEPLFAKLAYEDLLKMVQNLPPAYRTVFNLYVVEHFTHEEISKQLNISASTSKSNLTRARQKLQEIYKKMS